MRLDKFVGNNTQFSRTQIHSAIKQGLISVNDQLIKKTNTLINEDDKVAYAGQLIEARKLRYLMLYKPVGYVSANSDSEHPTLLDLLDMPFKQELQIAGRLDLDTTGLVLLTDDGAWNHKVTSPKHMHTKTYLVTTANTLTEDLVIRFAEGLSLKGEAKNTLPAELIILDSHRARLSIYEGKYHQVKRMFAAVGNHVNALHRERIGSICLDANLQPGQFRELTPDEIASFEKQP